MKQGTLGNQEFQGRQKAREKDKERTKKSDFAFITSSPQGLRFCWRLISEECRTFDPTFTGNSQTFHLEGKRAVGLWLLQQLQDNHPDRYVEMVRLAMASKREDAIHHKAAEQAAEAENEE